MLMTPDAGTTVGCGGMTRSPAKIEWSRVLFEVPGRSTPLVDLLPILTVNRLALIPRSLYARRSEPLRQSHCVWRRRMGVDETAEQLITAGSATPVIIVAIGNTASRIDEYTPSVDATVGGGGSADLYARLIVEELKPMIDARYRTLTDADHTGVAGSSLGGLVSMHFGLVRSNVFHRIGVVSPSVWWRPHHCRSRECAACHAPAHDLGGHRDRRRFGLGHRDCHGRAAASRRVDRQRVEPRRTSYREYVGAMHNETAWAARFGRRTAVSLPAVMRRSPRHADFLKKRTFRRTTARRRLTSHRRVMASDLRGRQQMVIDGNLANGTLKPRIERHRADVQRTVVRDRNHAVLARAAGRIVIRLVPFDAVHPDVQRARISRCIGAIRGLRTRRVFANHMIPVTRLNQSTRRLKVRARSQSRGRMNFIQENEGCTS